MSELARLETFCDHLEQSEVDRVVVRWIDEKRPVQESGEVAIRTVREATLKAAPDGEIVSRTFEEVQYSELRSTLEGYSFEVLYRNDNLTRW